MSDNNFKKILIVDDEENVRKSISYFLEDCGYQISEASDGAEALRIFKQDSPDVVIVDLRMPEVDGLTVLSHMKKMCPDLPVIVISGAGRISDVVEALRSGAWDYLIKPVEDLTVIKHVVEKAREKLILLKENKIYQENLERLVAERTSELKKELYQRKRAEEKIYKLSLAVEQSPASVVISDRQGIVEYVNQKFTKISGYKSSDLVGKLIDIFRSEYVPEAQKCVIWETIGAGDEWFGEICNHKKNGDFYWEYVSISPIKNGNGVISNFLVVREDITYRKEYESRLKHQAHYDSLTDLPNRILAFDRLSQALLRAQRQNKMVAVMFIDLDQFKMVNDTLGHTEGDALLIEAARRIKTIIRESDTVGRIGGDEFLVILPDLNQLEEAEVVARKILNIFNEPFLLGEKEIFMTASIGITISPSDGQTAEILFKNADAAMYKAKDVSRNTIQFYTNKITEQVNKHMEIAVCLRHALEKGEFFIHYQPMTDLKTGMISGVEALLRWKNPKLGYLMPGQFITLAEETGLIVPIGEWVMNTACKQVKEWQDYFEKNLRLGVNISFRQFRGKDLVSVVSQAIDKSGLSPLCLDLEITESLLMKDNKITQNIFAGLNELGVNIAIDDFGTGYSSFTYLMKFPFNTLKVDQSFVQGVINNLETAALTKAIISLAHSLKLKLIGEGVETLEQLEYLRSQGCQWAQGFYFSKPLSAEDFFKYANSHI